MANNRFETFRAIGKIQQSLRVGWVIVSQTDELRGIRQTRFEQRVEFAKRLPTDIREPSDGAGSTRAYWVAIRPTYHDRSAWPRGGA
jgi:hypothetical protein